MKDLSLHILDIAQNSITAGAGLITISINDDPVSNQYILKMIDNGKGMDKEMLKKVCDPFFTTRKTRKVGLGIPLLKVNAERTGGSFEIKSATGAGTEVNATFIHNHIDRLPEGDLAGTIMLLVRANPSIDFIFEYSTSSGNYSFDTREVKKVLNDVSIADPEVYKYLKEMILEQIQELKTAQSNYIPVN